MVDVFIAIQQLRTKINSSFFSAKQQGNLGTRVSEVLDRLVESYKMIFTALDFAWCSGTVFAITNDLSVVTKAIKDSLNKMIETHEGWETIQGEGSKIARRPYMVKVMKREIDNLILFTSSIPSTSRLVIIPKAEVKAGPKPDRESKVELESKAELESTEHKIEDNEDKFELPNAKVEPKVEPEVEPKVEPKDNHNGVEDSVPTGEVWFGVTRCDNDVASVAGYIM